MCAGGADDVSHPGEAPAARVAPILARYEVEGVLEVTYVGQVEEKEVRGYGGRPSRVERERIGGQGR